VPREEIFLTTKVWIEHNGEEAAYASALESLRKLQTDYLDLLLLHQPFGDAYGAWRALERLYEDDKVRAIGISNYYVDRMVEFANFNRIRKHPTTGDAITSPFVQMSQSFQKQANLIWYERIFPKAYLFRLATCRRVSLQEWPYLRRRINNGEADANERIRFLLF
jgi:aryl-alcohol dehydrogenase-like predicted oxidoreductase